MGNGIVATYGARALISNACTTKLTAMTNCDVYRNDLVAAAMPTTGNFPCWKCASGKLAVATPGTQTDTSGAVTTADWDNTMTIAFTCDDALPASTTATLANCDLKVYVAGSAANAAYACMISAAGYKFDQTSAAATLGATLGTHSITGCSNYIYDVATSTANECHNPTSGHAISSTGIIGVAFTVDTNCRKLSVGDLVCGVCTDAYFFGGAKCYLAARMLALSAAAFLFAWLL